MLISSYVYGILTSGIPNVLFDALCFVAVKIIGI